MEGVCQKHLELVSQQEHLFLANLVLYNFSGQVGFFIYFMIDCVSMSKSWLFHQQRRKCKKKILWQTPTYKFLKAVSKY